MGGELDSTNVIDTPECAVITSIGLDHTKQLGSTLSLVASAKAGIIKGGDVVSYESEGEAWEVIEKKCEKVGANLTCPDFSLIKNLKSDISGSSFDYKKHKGIKIPLAGTYQPKNCVTAVEALDVLAAKGYDISEETLLCGLAEVKWSGRFEILGKNPVFILDGGHNPHGLTAFADSMKTLFEGKKAVFIVGAMADKDIDGMFAKIVPFADVFYTVTPENDRALDAELLAQRICALGAEAKACGSFSDAVELALSRAGKDGIVAALGSLYFSSDIRKAYEKHVQNV